MVENDYPHREVMYLRDWHPGTRMTDPFSELEEQLDGINKKKEHNDSNAVLVM